MKTVKRFFRLVHINFILLKYGLDDIVLKTHLFRPLRFFIYLSPTRLRKIQHIPRGIRIREALEELGPIFVKFGQVLSTRVDAVPPDIVRELVLLQDKVPPFCGITAERIIAHALGMPLEQAFQSFDTTPLASASVAQVHAATLLDGRAVVVKVLRPNAQKIIDRDVALLKTIANLAHRYWKASRRFKPKEMVKEFEKNLKDELDLMREAANASQLRRNFKDSALLYVPEIHWPLTKNNILVIERVYGVPISNIEQLKQLGIDVKMLASHLIEIFFIQAFRDCFFHADMHPGNIWVSTKNPVSPQCIAMDFGIMGTLSPNDQRYLAENFLAFFKRDYRRVAELHQESGWIPSMVRIDEFEAAIRTVCEPIFERPLKDISFGNMLLRLFQTATQFKINIQPQLILLQKTLLNVEGLGRQLDPDLDLWNTAKPLLENWMKTQIGPQALLRKIKNKGPYWLEQLPDIPGFLYRILSNMATSSPGSLATNVNQEWGIMKETKEAERHSKSVRDVSLGILLGIIVSFAGFQLITHYF